MSYDKKDVTSVEVIGIPKNIKIPKIMEPAGEFYRINDKDLQLIKSLTIKFNSKKYGNVESFENVLSSGCRVEIGFRDGVISNTLLRIEY